MAWNPFTRMAPKPPALTAAASIVAAPKSPLLKTPDNWQREVWDFYDNLGEFNYAVTWLSQMMSRVRIRAAMLDPNLDEPSILDVPKDALAARMIRDLAGGVGGQSQMMKNITVHLSTPGEGYLIGEQIGSAFSWMVRSQEEVRATGGRFEVVGNRIPNVQWVGLPDNSLVVRVWRPHPRYYHIADSPARSAISVMRELELVNRHITAEYLSRLAMAGLLIMPTEASFPVREEFADEPDPFAMEFVEIAAESIREPGHASSIVPMLIRVPAEIADKIRHIDFTLQLDEKIIERRNNAINRLANKLDIPAEILTGKGAVNHWTAWNLDESALKTHIAPMAELICHCLTMGYLQPRLAASGEADVGQWVVWYDLSELAQRPDRSENATVAYDRQELSGAAYRRELGFDEDDAPTTQELEEIGLKLLMRTVPNLASDALNKIVGHDVLDQPVAPTGGVPPSGGAPQTDQQDKGVQPGPPGDGTQPEPPSGSGKGEPVPKAPKAAAMDRVLEQARALHAVRFSGTRDPVLLHPPVCASNAYGCPFTHAAEEALITRLSSGSYEARLDPYGRFIVGAGVPWLDTSGWITTETTVLSRRRANGHAVRQ
jgi:hypothetical protein